MMRIISWNIRAGGGRRAADIANQLNQWQPDIVALQEFRATPPSRWLANELLCLGLVYQLATSDSQHLATNALLLASRYPLAQIELQTELNLSRRWLLARIEAPPEPFSIGVLHVPNFVTGKKQSFLEMVLTITKEWQFGPGLLIGDTNSGIPGLDEESKAFTNLEKSWIQSLEGCGWIDCFRHLKGDERAFTWYSPNGRNGFRIDQAFLNPQLMACAQDMRYAWGMDGGIALSDHAAILLDLYFNTTRSQTISH